jgi:hypothetical protein
MAMHLEELVSLLIAFAIFGMVVGVLVYDANYDVRLMTTEMAGLV